MIGLILLLILFLSFLAYVAWAAAYLALRIRPAMSWTKIATLFIIVFCIIGALAGWRRVVGEEDLSGLSLLVYPVGAIGIIVCLSAVIGTAIEIYRKGNCS
ncbi:hypothetical protein E4K66_16290 [Bradyrhizobium frederickii]|uniref:Uncharacterized protein n=1 Tax=Bradyrhizobium frederickii TaxID=2560054 RepID=A0A4Y9L6P2_9BRAD|nr:hypothetical protein [Bradyrhizobium frederickii]TFV37994.1 hypothetical protein E4K66_16290 [Bradyrhizobium frederickii]